MMKEGKTNRSLLLAVAAGLLTVALAGCAGGAETTAQPAAAAGKTVDMKDIKFSTATLKVTAGTKVTWKNSDAMVHTVTADDGSFDSGDMAPGATWSHTFDTPGTYTYHCTPHAAKGADGKWQGMVATVVVS